MLYAPQPFDAAVRRLDSKTPVASRMRTREWSNVPIGLRESAQFSAGVDNIRAMSSVQEKLGEALRFDDPSRSFMDRSKFVAEQRQLLNELGLNNGSAAVTNPASRRRLEMIYDMQTEEAMSYGRYKVGQDEAALRAYPAQELIRVESREVPRQWRRIWADRGGKTFGGRMIALKTDPIWSAISRFGRPYPPFDFGSGMGVRNVSRRDALRLGVLQEDQEVRPNVQDYNEELERSVLNLEDGDKAELLAHFGDQVVEVDGRVQWRGNAIGELVQKSVTDPKLAWTRNLGRATQVTAARAAEAGVDLTGRTMTLTAQDVRQIFGAPRPEGQLPIRLVDFAYAPHVWWWPEQVDLSDDGRILLRKALAGSHMTVEVEQLGTAVNITNLYREAPQS